MDGLAAQVLPPLDLGPRVQPLRWQLGESRCRVTFEQYLERVDFFFKHIPNTPEAALEAHAPMFWPSTALLADRFKGQTAIIVGGGPDLTDSFHELSAQIDQLGDKCKVFAPNRSHDWLINGEKIRDKKWKRHPIIPHFGVLTDPSDFVSTYQTPDKRVVYLLTPMLHWTVVKKYVEASVPCFVWMPMYAEDHRDLKILGEKYPNYPMHFVTGGSTVGLRTINIAHFMGFEEVHLYGFSSCYAPGRHNRTLYSYDKPNTQHDEVDSTIRCQTDGTTFRYRSNVMMAKQAMEFDDMLDRLPHLQVDGTKKQMRIVVHGDGLIPWLAWKASGPNTLIQHATPDRMAEKYGTGSYDFVESRAA